MPSFTRNHCYIWFIQKIDALVYQVGLIQTLKVISQQIQKKPSGLTNDQPTETIPCSSKRNIVYSRDLVYLVYSKDQVSFQTL